MERNYEDPPAMLGPPSWEFLGPPRPPLFCLTGARLAPCIWSFICGPKPMEGGPCCSVKPGPPNGPTIYSIQGTSAAEETQWNDWDLTCGLYITNIGLQTMSPLHCSHESKVFITHDQAITTGLDFWFWAPHPLTQHASKQQDLALDIISRGINQH